MIPIIIPFYREHDKLAKCRAAIAAQTYPDLEVFVRDNTHDNILYTAAVNEGLARYCFRADVRYVLVLNQDAYMQEDCVKHLVEYMDAHHECGIACPLQVTAAEGGPRRVTWGGSWDAFPAGVHRLDSFQSYREPLETFWANGACMLLRAEMIREVGMFDRNLRFICSDSDLSFTARARGWQVCVVPQALSEHSLAASGTQAPAEIQLVKVRDALYFAEKWVTGGLYRRLSFEGPGLTAIGARQWVGKLRRMSRVLEQRTGSVAMEDPRGILWSMFMQLPAPPQRRGGF